MRPVKFENLEIVPELSDVFSHCLRTMNAISPRFPFLRFAALLHDIGKVQTKTFDPIKQDFTFKNHENVSAKLAANITKRFNFSKGDQIYISALIKHHMYFIAEDTKNSTIKRWMATNPCYRDSLRLRFADRLANLTKHSKKQTPFFLRLLIKKVRAVESNPPIFTVAHLAVSGNDVMNYLNIPPSKRVGVILNKLLNYVLDNESAVNSKPHLLNYLDSIRKDI